MADPQASNKTWILTGSPDNFAVNVERDFDVIGFKERRRNQAEQMAVGDEIIFYLTQVQEFGAIARVTSEMFEDRTKIWPGAPKKPDPYPWRVDAEPVVVLDPQSYVPAVEMVGKLEHIAKWPAEHWHLAFQGQLRIINEHDTELLNERIRAAAATSAAS